MRNTKLRKRLEFVALKAAVEQVRGEYALSASGERAA